MIALVIVLILAKFHPAYHQLMKTRLNRVYMPLRGRIIVQAHIVPQNILQGQWKPVMAARLP